MKGKKGKIASADEEQRNWKAHTSLVEKLKVQP